MKRRWSKKFFWAVIFWLVTVWIDSPLLAVDPAITSILRCQPPRIEQSELRLSCQYRLLPPEGVIRVTASLAGKELAVTDLTMYPCTDDNGVLLFLVDVSDPARRAVVAKNAQVIQNLIERGGAQHRFGIALFDRQFQLLAAIGTNRTELLKAIKKITAQGMTTEFYRSLLDAIQILEPIVASRKEILLFSDGLAEDTAYSHSDVMRRANEAGVVIHSLGYASTLAQTPALQLLRRLSEESGGFYSAADTNFELPAQVINNLWLYLNNGGSFTVNLASITGQNTVDVRLHLNDGSESTQHWPIHVLPAAVIETAPTAQSDQSPQTKSSTATAEAVNQASTKSSTDSTKTVSSATSQPGAFPWWLAISLIVALTMLAIWDRLSRKRRIQLSSDVEPVIESVVEEQDLPPILAILEWIDDSRDRASFMICKPICHIGRHSENDVQLVNEKVSGFHAELHQDRQGYFNLIDLQSINGTWVNGIRNERHLLQDGDVIQIGEVRLRFHYGLTDQ